ncbi:unnamed protein product [Mesocestoides corti]|uniref:rRNA-processing protein EBP2 n=1 Tax=Mesocestoides corti TaxID=53468 RepID=A0A3P6GTY0_MESCO|nr:unnamed protein product [Mesocestoides corti]
MERIRNRLPWVEHTDLENDFDKVDPNDDFKREALFYRVAQAAVLEALPRLHELGIPTKRPSDYFAEMIKSDAHMTKVREHLVVNKKRLELRERARQLREQRKFGKQQQKEILEARRLEKKKHMEALKAAKKSPGESSLPLLSKCLRFFRGLSLDLAFRLEWFNYLFVFGRINHKRVYKNHKYGFGGQKKRSKRNDSLSIRSMGKGDVSILSHKASSSKIKKLQKKMLKSKRKNTQKQRRKLATV